MRHGARGVESDREARSAAMAWRSYDPERDPTPPAPGLPPVQTRLSCHRSSQRLPIMLAGGLALAYLLLTTVWLVLR